jgi:hypothetical protein
MMPPPLHHARREAGVELPSILNMVGIAAVARAATSDVQTKSNLL